MQVLLPSWADRLFALLARRPHSQSPADCNYRRGDTISLATLQRVLHTPGVILRQVLCLCAVCSAWFDGH